MATPKSLCFDAIDNLKLEIRCWGRNVDAFAQNFAALSIDEREQLSRHAGPKLKYELLCQVLAHALRRLEGATDSDRNTILTWCFSVLVFEDFDFDCRENILRLTDVFGVVEDCRIDQREAWGAFSELASKKVLKHLSGINGSPTFAA